MEKNTIGDKSPLSQELWEEALRDLQGELDPQIYSAFIQPLRPCWLSREDSVVCASAPSKLVRNHVEKNFRARIEKAFRHQLGFEGIELKLSVEPANREPASFGSASNSSSTNKSQGDVRNGNERSDHVSSVQSSSTLENRPVSQSRQGGAGSPYIVVKKLKSGARKGKLNEAGDFQHNINTKYTFAKFVVGSNSQFCHAAAMQVAEEPGGTYNPLFIYGGVGLGKTHLLHAIGNAVLASRPTARVMYLSSETFTNELIQALRFGKMDDFKNRMRSIEVLLIDDIQFMCGKERTQEEFFHTFNALYNAKHQIVITSDKTPQDIPGIEERLKTRFSWGLTADLQAPDFETRVAIIKRKAALNSVVLPEEVAHFIAEAVSSNVRELEGALTRLQALSSLQNLPITLELAKSALKPLYDSKPANISVDEIKRAVATHFSIKVSEMVSKRRTKNLSFPRHIAMYLCRKHTTCSYPEIGGHFGGRDHSSVIHAANVVSTKLKSTTEVQQHVAQIEQVLLRN